MVFLRREIVFLMMGEAVSGQCQPDHIPVLIACSCIFLVSHLPHVPQELPGPRGSAVMVDSMGLVP